MLEKVKDQPAATRSFWALGAFLVFVGGLWILAEHVAIPLIITILTREPFQTSLGLWDVVGHGIIMGTGLLLLDLRIARMAGDLLVKVLPHK